MVKNHKNNGLEWDYDWGKEKGEVFTILYFYTMVRITEVFVYNCALYSIFVLEVFWVWVLFLNS